MVYRSVGSDFATHAHDPFHDRPQRTRVDARERPRNLRSRCAALVAARGHAPPSPSASASYSLTTPRVRIVRSCSKKTTCKSAAVTMQTDKAQQLEYNLGVLKRRDAAITKIIDMAGHVVLYQFNEDTQAWDRKNVEGSLFIVARSSAPAHQFVVLNRLSSENLVESITEDFQTELTDQFLLYRTHKAEILGIWCVALSGCLPPCVPFLPPGVALPTALAGPADRRPAREQVLLAAGARGHLQPPQLSCRRSRRGTCARARARARTHVHVQASVHTRTHVHVHARHNDGYAA